MYLKAVESSVASGAYGTDPHAFLSELLLIAHNCALYNAGAPVWEAAAARWEGAVRAEFARLVTGPDGAAAERAERMEAARRATAARFAAEEAAAAQEEKYV